MSRAPDSNLTSKAAARDASMPATSSCIPCVLSVWLGAQLVALAIGAAGAKLSARFPEPPSSIALHEMLCTQLLVATLLFPWLMGGGWRMVVVVVATMWPFILLAATVAETSTIAAI